MYEDKTPSLFIRPPRTAAAAAGAPAVPPERQERPEREANTLLELLYDGFYMIFLMRNRSLPESAQAFRERVREFLLGFERGSKKLDSPGEAVYLAKFAYCALVDEVVLNSQTRIRDDWERRPLQLELFGEQLAGERFFEHLETLRERGAPSLQPLEVFHMCLLMGFTGKYIVEGSERLGYLTSRVGEEIAAMKGQRKGFAPHWAAPDRVMHTLRSDVPLWVVGSLFAFVGLAGYAGVRWALERQTRVDLAAYAQVVTLPPAPAQVTIRLP